MEIYQKRLEQLQQTLFEQGCEGMILDDQINLYYMTGLFLSSGKLLVHPRGAFLLVDNRYYELCRKSSPFPVFLIKHPFAYLDFLAEEELQFLGFDSVHTSYKDFIELENQIALLNQEKRRERPVVLKPLENPVMKLRLIKDASELLLLQEAASLGTQGFKYLCTLLKEGITEEELALELELFWKQRGSKGVAFEPIIAFGPNSSMPHYRAGKAALKKGQPVLIDIGVNLNHYHSDMTRVVFYGEPDPKILEIHQIVKRAQEEALKLCRPGIPIAALDEAARSVISTEGYGDYFTHSLGHGVGLEIHETPTLRNVPINQTTLLQPGMVVTIEPGIYLPGIGGVRIEDMIAITETGFKNLTNAPVDPHP